MKRFLLIILLSFLSLSAFAEDEKQRLSDLYSPVFKIYGDADTHCTQGATNASLTYSGTWSWISSNRISCSVAKNPDNYTTVELELSCPKGEIDQEKFGCYGKEEEPKSCPAAGTIAFPITDPNENFPTGSSGLMCIEDCQVKIPGHVVCVEIDGVKGCSAGGGGNATYTGNQCTGSEYDTSGTGGNGDGSGNGEGNGSGNGEGNGSGNGEGNGSGNGSGGDGEGNGNGSGGSGGGNGSGGSGSGDGDGKGEGEEGEDETGNSKWGGNCAAGFTAEGDALAVAIAKAEWERNCTFIHNPKDSDEYKFYEANKGSNQGKGGALDGLPKETINLNQHLSNTNLLGGGACLPDYNFTIFGRSIPLPISKYCDLFKWIGIVLQALAMIWGARIALGGL